MTSTEPTVIVILGPPFLLGVHGDTSKPPLAVALLSNGQAQVAFADGTQVRQPARRASVQ